MSSPGTVILGKKIAYDDTLLYPYLCRSVRAVAAKDKKPIGGKNLALVHYKLSSESPAAPGWIIVGSSDPSRGLHSEKVVVQALNGLLGQLNTQFQNEVKVYQAAQTEYQKALATYNAAHPGGTGGGDAMDTAPIPPALPQRPVIWITALYTERAPCGSGAGMADCNDMLKTNLTEWYKPLSGNNARIKAMYVSEDDLVQWSFEYPSGGKDEIDAIINNIADGVIEAADKATQAQAIKELKQYFRDWTKEMRSEITKQLKAYDSSKPFLLKTQPKDTNLAQKISAALT
jgi:hypothetical protein